MISIQNKPEYDCDVLIVGGGPAGSALAYHLAVAGMSVVVVDAERFPRDKVCGDGVSPIAIAELHKMGITNSRKFARTNEINEVGLFIRNDKVFVNLSKPDHLPYHAHIIPRIELDYWIYSAAKKKGATFLEETRFISYQINEDGVLIQLKTADKKFLLTAKVIVGADGSSSAVARHLQGSKPNDQFQLLGLRAYYEGVSGPDNRVDIYFSEESFPGIYWMFPKGPAGANVGMAMVSATIPQKPTHVKQLLQQHIEKNKDIRDRIGNGQLQGKILGWPITFFNASNPISDDRLLLVGDAAGLINPLSGDGIQYALLSARWAAETLIQCRDANDYAAVKLSRYRKKVDAELAYDFAFSNLLVQLAKNKSFSPVWMEIIATLIGRAKTDKKYADTIAGIFEGTYPSYQALTGDFIIKSLLQAGVSGLNGVMQTIQNPSGAFVKGSGLVETASQVLEGVTNHADDHRKWLGDVLSKGFVVAGHAFNHILKARK